MMNKLDFLAENSEKVILINEDSDLIGEIVDFIISNLNLDDCVVIFPNRRAIHYFYSRLSKRLKSTIKALPAYSIDDFIDYLYEESKAAFKKINILESIDLIFNLLNTPEKFDSFKKAYRSFEEFLPWGEELFKSFEELIINNVDFNCFEKIKTASQSSFEENILINKVLKTDFYFRINDFFELYKDFYLELENKRLSTRALRYNYVQKINLPEKIFIVCGFISINKSEKEIFRNILNNRKSYFFLKRSYNFYNLENKKFYIYQSQTLSGEAIELRKVLEQKKPLTNKDLILLPSETSLFPVLYSSIPNGEKYNISIGYPLSRTPIYSLFDMISVLLSRMNNLKFYAKDYINLLFHPYIKTLKFDSFPLSSDNIKNIESTVTRTLFQRIHANIRQNNEIFVSLNEIEGKSEIFKNVLDILKSYDIQIDSEENFINCLNDFLIEVHNKIIRTFLSVKDLTDFTEKITELLDYISNKSLGHLTFFGSIFFRYTYETIFELSSTRISNIKLRSYNQYFNLLKYFIQNSRVPFSSSILDGIQILGSLETRNINFDRVFYLDISDDNVPSVSRENLFLTPDIRKILELPSVKESEDVQKANFIDLINGAKEIHFFYSNSDGKTISRFVEGLIWELQKINRSVAMPINSKTVNFQVSFAQQNPDAIEKNENIVNFLENFEYSPTSIDKYLRCPLSFYYSYVLNLQEHRQIEEDFSNLAIGNLIHEVLYLYFKDWLNVEFKRVDFETELDKIYKILNKKFQNIQSREILLQKEQCKLALKKVLEKNINELSEMKILYLEKRFDKQIIINGKKIKLVGKVDRIHKIKSEYYLIDYKTGAFKMPKRSFIPTFENRNLWYENIKSFQLPFYIFLFESFQRITYDQIISGIWNLKDINNEEYFQFDNESYKAYYDALQYLISEILNINKPFLPASTNIEEKCVFCLYQTMCSRQWVKSRKFS